MSKHATDEGSDLREKAQRSAALVDQLHAIIDQLEDLHDGRKFPPDGHLVGSLAQVAAEAMFAIRLLPPFTPGPDAHGRDHRAVHVKGTYGTSGVGFRAASSEPDAAIIVLRLSRTSGEPHEIVYNGPLAVAAASTRPVGANRQTHLSLSRLRHLNAASMPRTE